jgi:hypothetical protein
MAITVQELINQLQFMDPNAEVHFTYNYNDHWRTQVAPEVDSVEVGYVRYSDYHRMNKVLDDDCDIYLEDGERDEDVTEVVLIG